MYCLVDATTGNIVMRFKGTAPVLKCNAERYRVVYFFTMEGE